MNTRLKNKGNIVIGILFWGLVIWGIVSLFSSDSSDDYSDTTYYGSNYSTEVQDYDNNLTFNGYDCTDDCSGHEAGYSWAEENDISDEYDCDGNSNSFNEGCILYVEENY